MLNPLRASRLLIVAVVLVTFGRNFWNGFVTFDDPATLSENIRLLPPSVAGIGYYWTHSAWDLYVPVTYTAWSLLAAAAQTTSGPTGMPGLNPAVFHGANVVVHAMAALVVFEVLRLVIKHRPSALAGALLFAVHPVQAESVSWASGLKDLLCGWLTLTAVWQYLLCARSGGSPRRGRYCLALLAAAAAMLSKPTAVVAPLVAGALAVVCLRRDARRVTWEMTPWLLLSAACAAVAKVVQPARNFTGRVPWLQRPLVAADALAFYLYKLAWPMNLAVDYARSPASVLKTSPFWAWWTWALPAAVFVVLWSRRRRWREPAAGGAAFVAALLPVLGFVPFDFQAASTVTDHYLYLPMFGVALAAAWAVSRRPTRGTALACAAIIAALAARSFAQCGYWRDSESLYRHGVAVRPESYLSRNNLGVALAAKGDIPGAVEQYEAAIRVNPEAAAEFRFVADAKFQLGDPAEGIEYARRLVELQPRLPAGNRTDPAELRHWYGMLWMRRGDASLQNGDRETAKAAYARSIEQLTEARRINPQFLSGSKDLQSARERLATVERASSQP